MIAEYTPTYKIAWYQPRNPGLFFYLGGYMDKRKLKYTYGQLKSKLTTRLVLGLLSLCCLNIYAVIAVPCAVIGLILLNKDGDWEQIHRDDVRRLSESNKQFESSPPEYKPDTREEHEKYYEKYIAKLDNQSKAEKEKIYRDYLDWYDKDFPERLKKYNAEKEMRKKQLDNLRPQKMPDDVLCRYLRVQRLANVSLFFVVVPLVLRIIFEVLEIGNGIQNAIMSIFL